MKVELPRGSGCRANLAQVADEVSRRLVSIFLWDDARGGRRPVLGEDSFVHHDEHWRDYIPFHEYFHGDRGAGLGASHLEVGCRRAFDIGPVRTMEQDVEFGVLQIVDIALKAISPAVNDATTATTRVDQLGRILLRASFRPPPESVLRDPDGLARVVLRRTSFPRLLDVAFSQIRHHGKSDVAEPPRPMRALGDLAARCGVLPTPSRSSTRPVGWRRYVPGASRWMTGGTGRAARSRRTICGRLDGARSRTGPMREVHCLQIHEGMREVRWPWPITLPGSASVGDQILTAAHGH